MDFPWTRWGHDVGVVQNRVHIRLCTYIDTCTIKQAYLHIKNMYIWICVCMYIYMEAHVSIYLSVSLYVHLLIYLSAYFMYSESFEPQLQATRLALVQSISIFRWPAWSWTPNSSMYSSPQTCILYIMLGALLLFCSPFIGNRPSVWAPQLLALPWQAYCVLCVVLKVVACALSSYMVYDGYIGFQTRCPWYRPLV